MSTNRMNVFHTNMFPEASKEYLTASAISHELRNPVTLVNSYLQLFCTSHPEVRSFPYWQEISENMELLKKLLNSLSVYNRSWQLQREPLQPDHLLLGILRSIEPVCREKNITFVLDIAPDLPSIYGDAIKLRQLFFNLLNNSIEAMPAGGQITIKFWSLEHVLFLSFKDTGEGIPKERISTVFSPFTTSKPNGTGLGLPIIRRIANAHGGSIRLISSSEQGTCFLLTFPVLTDETEEG